MGSGRWIRVALSTAILVLLGCGAVTLGLSGAGHAAVGRHMAAEAGSGVATVGESDQADLRLGRHDSPAERDRAHPEHGLHLLGACAAILAAGLAVLLGRRPRSTDVAASGSPGPEPSWSTTAAPHGLGPPARTEFCVQLC